MPATRPVTDKASDPVEGEEATNQATGGIPFTMTYDKLVIAVGAYSQSENHSNPFVKSFNPYPSVQHPGREGACTFSQRYQGRSQNS